MTSIFPNAGMNSPIEMDWHANPGGCIMITGYFNSQQIDALYRELDLECAQFAREHGWVTAAQRNEIAARLMERAQKNPPPRVPVEVVGPHGT
jgi:hypothetical protein